MDLNYHRSGSGEPLVLMHGIAGRWEWWRPELDALEARHDVIALDLPGFGSSPSPPPDAPAGAPSLATLVARFFDAQGLDRPHLVGSSLGGWIALELAKRGRAASVTCFSPAGFHTPREGRYQRAFLTINVALARVVLPAGGVLFATPLGRAALLGGLFAKPWKMTREDALGIVEAGTTAPWFKDTLAAINQPEHFTGGEQIDVPVTIAWGNQDHLLLPRQAARAIRLIPRARLVRLPGCGHVPTFDDPGLIAGVILETTQTAMQAQRRAPAPA
jgi:pimeloyl-ACP methyl ester carboxylesterase